MSSLQGQARSRERELVNVSLDPYLLAEARSLGISLSATMAEALRVRIAEARHAAWLQENAAAIEAYNERVERLGVWSGVHRRF